ncbi:hypothetical protein BDW22DRAFT_1358277 [Trametopsis cervina]|nr:hypothetical protein BDW22DRAFT_1358277 [Trametopsis cervina]
MRAELIQAGHESDLEGTYPNDPAAAPRAPSRAGFMRPQLRRQHAFTDLEWTEKSGELDDEGEWEFASTLLVPFEPSSSDDSDFSDDTSDSDSLDIPSKPLLPPNTIPVVQASKEPSPIHTFVESPSTTAHIEDIHPTISLEPTDHGLSRSALTSLKEFWHSRFDEYAKAETYGSAYGGIIDMNHSSRSLRNLLSSRLGNSATQQRFPAESPQPRLSTPNPNALIYPRTGSLSSLRDSRSATLDRVFCNYPLYSIHKTLFLHDMLRRASNDASTDDSESPLLSEVHPRADVSLSPTDETFVDISLSQSSSNDNDATFVSAETSLCSTHGCQINTCDEKYQPELVHTVECTRQWEIDWTERWKVLLDLSKDNSGYFRLNTYRVDETAFFAALSPERSKAKFFFADEDEFAGLEDDDDDYGLEVAQPVYRVTAEALSKEYLRALEMRGAA